jgi:hypothetical protein
MRLGTVLFSHRLVRNGGVMTDRQQNIYNGATAALVSGSKSLKAVGEEVTRFLVEQKLGDRASQAEVLDAVFLIGGKTVKVYEQNDEVWLARVGTP